MKSSDLANKVYEILYDKCKDSFEEKNWREWHVWLRDREIESRGFDNQYDQIEELMNTINNYDNVIVCSDPWVSINEEYGHEGFLIVPTQIAEKIAVLRILP